MDVSAKIIDTFLSLDKHIRYSEEHGIVFDTEFCEAVECVVLVFRKKLEMDCVVKPRTTYNGYTRYKDYYCPIKRNTLWIHATTWMNLFFF